MNIKHLRNSEINAIKWDKCIGKAVNGIAYAYSWYLNIVSPDWEALVEDDYKSVMPLTNKKKYGISYLHQPYFTQQLGVFSTDKLNPEITELFLKKIPSKFRFVEIRLNTFNKLNINTFDVSNNITCQMDLIESYDVIKSRYSQNTKRNIKKAVKNQVVVFKGVRPNELIRLRQENPVNNLSSQNFDSLRQIFSFAVRCNVGEIYGAYTENNTLCAATFFLTTNNKSIMLIASSSEEGKEKRAAFRIIDEFIRNNAEKPRILDFEGSQIEGVARFFKGFGATPCQFPVVRANRLPWFLQLFKK